MLMNTLEAIVNKSYSKRFDATFIENIKNCQQN